MFKNNQIEWSFSTPEQRMQWPYNKWFNAFIKKRIRYSFVRRDWDCDIAEMATLDRIKDESNDPVNVPLNDTNKAVLRAIQQAGIDTLMKFLDQVGTLDKAEHFCRDAHIKPADLLDLLRKIYKYLPAGAQMRQLVAKDDTVTHEYIDRLVKYKLGFSLAFLEIARTAQGRKELVELTGIPEEGMMDLVLRADMTRLGLMGGGMVRQSWALGYKGLAVFDNVTPEEYHARSVEYYDRVGRGMPFDFTVKNVVSHVKRMQQAQSIIEY